MSIFLRMLSSSLLGRPRKTFSFWGLWHWAGAGQISKASTKPPSMDFCMDFPLSASGSQNSFSEGRPAVNLNSYLRNRSHYFIMERGIQRGRFMSEESFLTAEIHAKREHLLQIVRGMG